MTSQPINGAQPQPPVINIPQECAPQQAVQRLAAFVAGDVDHVDETTRQKVADDIAFLEYRAHKVLHAGTARTNQWWDEALTLVTFEEA